MSGPTGGHDDLHPVGTEDVPAGILLASVAHALRRVTTIVRGLDAASGDEDYNLLDVEYVLCLCALRVAYDREDVRQLFATLEPAYDDLHEAHLAAVELVTHPRLKAWLTVKLQAGWTEDDSFDEQRGRLEDDGFAE